jgi:hypothetical protein
VKEGWKEGKREEYRKNYKEGKDTSLLMFRTIIEIFHKVLFNECLKMHPPLMIFLCKKSFRLAHTSSETLLLHKFGG